MINFKFGAAHLCLALLTNLVAASGKNAKTANDYGGAHIYADEKFTAEAKEVAVAASNQ